MGGQPDKPYKVIALSTVRNEQDMIEPFVRHNLRFVDYMVIADNNSADATRPILEALARETGRLAVVDRFETAFTQGEFMTELLHGVQSSFFADFFVFLDADEFISAPDRETFDQALATIPRLSFGRMLWKTYILPKAQSFEAMAKDPPATMRWRRREEHERHYKAILRLDGLVVPSVKVGMGNHMIFAGDQKLLPSVVLPTIPLLHFPVRSEAQLAAKSIGGWMGILAKQKRGLPVGKNECHQWRENYERALAGTISEQLADASYFYSRPPGTVDWDKDVIEEDHGIRYERRYSSGAYGDKVALISRAWELSIGLKTPFLPEDCYAPRITRAKGFGVDRPMLRWLVDRLTPKSVLELSPGAGVNLHTLRSMGVDRVYGFGAAPVEQTFLTPSNYVQGELAAVETVGGQFDLVLCLGAFAEFSEATAKRVAAVFAGRAQKAIAFLPGAVASGGAGQDRLPLDRWLALWRGLGWVPDLGTTLAARALSNFHSLRRRLVVLVPEGPDSDMEATHFLNRLEKVRHVPAADQPALYEEAFSRNILEYIHGFQERPLAQPQKNQ